MHDIACPHCGKTYTIDEAGSADVIKQVRDQEFDQQLRERLGLAEPDRKNALELAQARAASEQQQAAVAKDSEIQELKARLEAGDVEQKLAVSEALAVVEKERDELKDRDDAIERLRDMKAKLSTKMVGETLKQHCWGRNET